MKPVYFLLSHRQRYGKGRSCTYCAFYADSASMHFDNPLGNGKSQSTASIRACSRFIGFVESLEDASLIFLIDAYSRIRYREFDSVFLSMQINTHSPTSWCKFDAVVD